MYSCLGDTFGSPTHKYKRNIRKQDVIIYATSYQDDYTVLQYFIVLSARGLLYVRLGDVTCLKLVLYKNRTYRA